VAIKINKIITFFITIKICYLISNNPKQIIHNPLSISQTILLYKPQTLASRLSPNPRISLFYYPITKKEIIVCQYTMIKYIKKD
jgi:hypothetical protein